VTEYLPGGSLLSILFDDKNVITSKMAVSMARDIASGMSHLHVSILF
jgi:serine/threonine protein kinase